MSTTEPFSPLAATTLACTAASASSSALNTSHPQVLLTNLGPNKLFFRISTGASTAVVTDTMLVLGQSKVFTKNAADTVSAICAATETATLSITTGFGN